LKRWVFVFRPGAVTGSWDYGSVRIRRYVECGTHMMNTPR
jgi:hypothetical protein